MPQRSSASPAPLPHWASPAVTAWRSLSRNRLELAIAEVAALHLGAVGLVLYTASPPATIEHVLRDSEPTALLLESGLRARLTDVDHAVEHVLSLDEMVGARVAPRPNCVERLRLRGGLALCAAR
jgi:hypothetical protein